jgi:hypothetical protein
MAGRIVMSTEVSGALAVLLAAVLTWAGVLKLRPATEFRDALAVLLPTALRAGARTAVPLAELALAGWLLSGVAPRLAGLTSAVLLAVFATAQVLLHRAGHPGCGCFGGATVRTGPDRARNVALLGIALVYTAFSRGPAWQADLLVAQVAVALGLLLTWYCGAALAVWRGVR